MPDNITKGSLKITAIYAENGKNIEELLADSFSVFIENGLAFRGGLRYNENCGRLLIGGAKCTRE